MKKFILSLLFGIGILFSMGSCAAYAQDVVITSDGEDVDVSLVIRYGTPYYYEGSLLYYLYDGWYYYPYLRGDYYYYYRYSRPLPPPRPGHRFVPGRHDRPHFRRHDDRRIERSSTYRQDRHHEPNRGRIESRPTQPRNNGGINRPNNNVPRVNTVRPSMGSSRSQMSRPSSPSMGSRPSPQISRGGGGGGRPSGGGHVGGRR